MKYLITLLVFASSCILNSAPVIVSDQKFEPAAPWPEGFEAEPWWKAFLALNMPESFSFQEWKTYFSPEMLDSAKIDEAKFADIKKEEAEKKKAEQLTSRIKRVVILREGNVDYAAITEAITSPDYPDDEFTKQQFFEKTDSGWIVYQISADLANDPLVKAIR